jgi:hypothetical protein
MEKEVGAEHFWDRENPLGVRGVGENFLREQLGEKSRSFGSARGAESATLAGKCHEKLETAPWTNGAGETGFEKSAVEIAGDGVIPIPLPEAVTPLESLFPQAFHGFVVLVEELIEGGGAWVARPVKGRTGFGLWEECGSCRHGAHGG